MIALLAVVLLAQAQRPPVAQAPRPPATRSFDRVAAQAAEARKAGRNSDALQLYREALRLKPSWTDGLWNLASILYDREDFGGARDALRKLVELDPKAMAAYALLGLSEYKTGEYDASLEHLDAAHAMGIPPDHPLGSATSYYLALLLNREGRHDAAAGLLLSAPEAKVVGSAMLIAIGMAGLRIARLPEQLPPAERDLALEVGRAMAAPEAEATAAMRSLLEAHPGQPNLHYLY